MRWCASGTCSLWLWWIRGLDSEQARFPEVDCPSVKLSHLAGNLQRLLVFVGDSTKYEAQVKQYLSLLPYVTK